MKTQRKQYVLTEEDMFHSWLSNKSHRQNIVTLKEARTLVRNGANIMTPLNYTRKVQEEE